MSEVKDDAMLRVSASSNPQSVASAIAHAVYEGGKCELRAVGAGAVNQAVKAIAIARGYAAPRGLDLVCIPAFQSIESNGDKISAMLFKVASVN
jgi:stage V sporulation protein S